MNGLIKVNLLENICYELRKSLAFEWIDCIDIDTLCVSDRETAVDSREKHTHTHRQLEWRLRRPRPPHSNQFRKKIHSLTHGDGIFKLNSVLPTTKTNEDDRIRKR